MAQSSAPGASAGTARRPIGKVRSPLAVILLSIITIGIYGLYWFYKTFQELKDHTGQGVGGGVGLILAILLGVVDWFLLPHEVSRLYESSGRRSPVAALTGLWNLIPLIGSIIWLVKVQGSLNAYWRSSG